MSGRVAVLSIAAFFLVVSPALSGIDTGTLVGDNIRIAAIVTPDETTEPKKLPANDPTEKSGPVGDSAPDEMLSHAPNNSQSVATRIVALGPVEQVIAPPPSAGPFGVAAIGVLAGNVLSKWRRVEADIRAENDVLAHCRDGTDRCPAAAQKFLDIIKEGRDQTGRARIGLINRAINLAIEPMSDIAQWGVPDRWSAPLETFATGRGDCEDYAIAKYAALTAAGIAPEDVKLVIVHNTALGEDHAVVAVRLDNAWIVLDNRWLALVADTEMQQAIPLFVLDSHGVRQFAGPPLMASRRTAAPASF